MTTDLKNYSADELMARLRELIAIELDHCSKEDYPYVSMQKKQIMAGATAPNSTVEIVEDMTLALNRLEEPEPERELSAAIMARVARLPSARASSPPHCTWHAP